MKTSNILAAIGLAMVAASGCADRSGSESIALRTSHEANLVGIHGYELVDGDSRDLVFQYDKRGALIGTLVSQHADGAATQSWSDDDGHQWELSSADACVSRDAECLGTTADAVVATGLISEQELSLRIKRASTTQADLRGYHGADSPFTVLGRDKSGAAARECVAVFDVFCSTSVYCHAMGGDASCGLFATRCCFE